MILTAAANGQEKEKGKEEPQALRARMKVATVATKKKKQRKEKGEKNRWLTRPPAQWTRDNGATDRQSQPRNRLNPCHIFRIRRVGEATRPSVEVASHLGLDRLILRGAQTASRASHTTMGVSISNAKSTRVSGRYTSRPVPLTTVETGAERTNPISMLHPVGCVPGDARSLVSEATSQIEEASSLSATNVRRQEWIRG